MAHLNLITCEGIWNKINGSYPLRRVVFTDSIPSEGPISVNPLLPTTAIPVSTPTQNPIPSTTPTPTSVPAVTPTTTVTNTPTTVSTTTTTPTTITTTTATSESLAQIAKSLYATPLDGLVTTILIIAIIFLVIEIIL